MDDEEYEDIMDDIKTECEKFGTVLSIEIPRPIEGKEVPGLNKVFVEFEDKTSCQKAAESLTGRKFADRIVVTSFMDPLKFQNRQF